MSTYTEKVLIEKLNKMSNSQQSIQTLSHWIMYHKKRYVESVKIWEKETFNAPRERKLIYLYLANDIMQTSRKKGEEFIREFKKIIKPCTIHIYKESDSQSQKAILRILDIWDERKVLPSSLIKEIRDNLINEETNNNLIKSQQEQHEYNSSTLTLPQKPPALISPQRNNHPIFLLLQQIEEHEVSIDLMAEKVSTIQKSFFNDNINGIFLINKNYLKLK
jgi:hypothetical protein